MELLELATSELLEERLSELGFTTGVELLDGLPPMLEFPPCCPPGAGGSFESDEQLAITQSIEIKTRYVRPFLDF
jgi:hypothetical protein